MWMIHAIKSAVRSGRHARKTGVGCWQSSAPFPTVAASAAETSFTAGQRLLKKRAGRNLDKSFPEPCSKEFNRSNDKQVSASSSGHSAYVRDFRIGPNRQRRLVGEATCR